MYKSTHFSFCFEQAFEMKYDDLFHTLFFFKFCIVSNKIVHYTFSFAPWDSSFSLPKAWMINKKDVLTAGILQVYHTEKKSNQIFLNESIFYIE